MLQGEFAMNESLYPPTVQGAPPELTIPNRAYRRQVVIVFASLFVFISFYLGLIIASGWMVVYALSESGSAGSPQGEQGSHSSGNGYWLLGIIAAVLFLFLVKALFKWQKQEQETRIEIIEREQPQLFAFIRRICEDTKAPFPYRIFLTTDVNAAVFYDSSLLSLILPVKKNLIIGLGLVNGLNLSEFKAVLAHEFGHFSQSSMRLGSYVYMANRIIYDLVYHRDALDVLLAKARRVDFRIAVFAYMITGVLWVLRKILQGAFKIINFFESALSRQMEFHADLVAVSVTGSDSLIHALKKLDFIHACQMQTFSDLKDASEHRLYTQDLFYHQTCAADHLRRTMDKPDFGTVPLLPADPLQKTQLFTRKSDEEGSNHDKMWASHPSHYDREQNAKRHYLRSVEDERSPWLLFSQPEQVRRRMTERFYQNVLELKSPVFAPPEQVQAFIEEEHAETTQDGRYLGLYDGRLLSIPTASLTAYANDPSLPALPEAQIQALLSNLYNAEYKTWMEAHHKRREENDLLETVDQGDGKQKKASTAFMFRGKSYRKADVKMLLMMVEKELEADAEWLKAFDREVFLVHLRMAQILSDGTSDNDLYQRYYFHLNLQDILKTARRQELQMIGLFRFLSSKENGLSASEFNGALAALEEVRQEINKAYQTSCALALPALQNMQTGMPLSEYLWQEPLLGPMTGKSIDGNWARALMKQISQMEERCRRLYFKSMGAILQRQEIIAQNYRSRNAS